MYAQNPQMNHIACPVRLCITKRLPGDSMHQSMYQKTRTPITIKKKHTCRKLHIKTHLRKIKITLFINKYLTAMKYR